MRSSQSQRLTVNQPTHLKTTKAFLRSIDKNVRIKLAATNYDTVTDTITLNNTILTEIDAN